MAKKALVIILLPGTIFHELSHFLLAAILGVQTGTISLLPRFENNGQIIAGETQIGRTDPIRYTLIGVAPFLAGLVAIYSIYKLYLFDNAAPLADLSSLVLIARNVMANISPGYVVALMVLFWVSNTMFSSAKDLEAAIVPLVLIYILAFVLFFSGTKIPLSQKSFSDLGIFFTELGIFLAISLFLNLLVAGFLGLLSGLWKRR